MSRSPKSLFLLLSLAVVVADQWSKWLIEEHLPLLASETVLPGLLALTHVRNTGVAFGLFAARGNLGATLALTVLGLVAMAIIGLYFFRTPSDERLLLGSLALILGGALGNLIDRLFAGAVTDFIDFYYRSYHFHTFNLADSAITIGILLMAFDALRRREAEPAES
jgi:signal peptidase II